MKGYTFSQSIMCYNCKRKFSPLYQGEEPNRIGWSSRRTCPHCGTVNEMHDTMMRQVWKWGPVKP